jgi:hypothetical protein
MHSSTNQIHFELAQEKTTSIPFGFVDGYQPHDEMQSIQR